MTPNPHKEAQLVRKLIFVMHNTGNCKASQFCCDSCMHVYTCAYVGREGSWLEVVKEDGKIWHLNIFTKEKSPKFKVCETLSGQSGKRGTFGKATPSCPNLEPKKV